MEFFVLAWLRVADRAILLKPGVAPFFSVAVYINVRCRVTDRAILC
jgi:hypothetical protein